MARGCIVLLGALGLAACAHEPMDYIPPTDRALLQAQSRLGDSGASAGPMSVDRMLRQARNAPDGNATDGRTPGNAGDPTRLLLHFTAQSVQLDDTQKAALDQFATAVSGKPVMVTSRPGNFADSAALLGQRRAVAVARQLQSSVADVQLRFLPDTPPDVVVVSAGAASAGSPAP